jgi:glycosyltransferase involved in cell wall biosynthesis
MTNNVFHIITHFELGGAETVAANICKSTSALYKYHLVAVVNSHSDYALSFRNSMEKNGVECHSPIWSNNKLSIILFPVYFLSLYLKYKPAVVHTHTEVPDLGLFVFKTLFSWLPGWKNVKIVRTIHNTKLWSDWGRIGKIVERYFQKTRTNIAISNSVRRSYLDVFGQDSPVIYNGVEEKVQIPFSGIVKNRLNLLFAGRFEEQKGIAELLQILEKFKDDHRFFFHIVGHGRMQHDVEDTVNTMNNARLYKQIFNLPVYLASFDYVIMPSHFEGLVLMSIEASMAHTPVLMNGSCKGLDETLPPDYPLAVSNNDLNQWYNLINQLPDVDREKVGQKAYLYVKDKFSILKMQQAYERLYAEK